MILNLSQSAHAVLRPVPTDAVRLTDAFWQPRRRVNTEETLLSQYRHLEDTGRIDNFRRAAGKKDIPFQGLHFNDSDVYKWLEAACWALAEPHPEDLARAIHIVSEEIADAQQPDGYLHTYFLFEKAPERWVTINQGLNTMHELYCAGHFFQAAIAHVRVTGSRRLLDVAIRFADHICDVFGPEDGQRHGTDGHPEIEMALVELARTTGDARYLRQAQYFLDVRIGQGRINDAEQDLTPYRELTRIGGHAVCAAYLAAGATDLVLETGETALKAAVDRLWSNMAERQMYVTGGIGSRWGVESFGDDYELPASRAYAETCAAIASIQWNARLLHLTGAARYADVLEQTLYNGFLAGLSLDGAEYFYQNPLADDGQHRRQPWFGCACCPPNIARLLAQLPGYVCSASGDGVWVHLYAQSEADLRLPDGRPFGFRVETRYPWEGEVALTVTDPPAGTAGLRLRIPAWAEGAAVSVCAGPPEAAAAGAYHEIVREWRAGDIVRLSFPMRPRLLEAHPLVTDARGQVALMRGPLVYCLEAADHAGADVRLFQISRPSDWESVWQPDLLGGVMTLRGSAFQPDESGWAGVLYRPAATVPDSARFPVTAIPYYAWANRDAGPMTIWMRAA